MAVRHPCWTLPPLKSFYEFCPAGNCRIIVDFGRRWACRTVGNRALTEFCRQALLRKAPQNRRRRVDGRNSCRTRSTRTTSLIVKIVLEDRHGGLEEWEKNHSSGLGRGPPTCGWTKRVIRRRLIDKSREVQDKSYRAWLLGLVVLCHQGTVDSRGLVACGVEVSGQEQSTHICSITKRHTVDVGGQTDRQTDRQTDKPEWMVLLGQHIVMGSSVGRPVCAIIVTIN